MAYENKPGQGSLWPNRDKKSERYPDKKGDLVCPHCKAKLVLSSWTKDYKGTDWDSLKAEEEGSWKPDPAKSKPRSAPKDEEEPW